jgi:hypothetical protein
MKEYKKILFVFFFRGWGRNSDRICPVIKSNSMLLELGIENFHFLKTLEC